MEQYSGSRDPFVFLAYAESDRETAEKTAALLSPQTRLFGAGRLGRREKRALDRAAAVILLVSEASLRFSEETAALAARLGKEIVPVYLDGTEKPAGLRFLLGGTQGLSRRDYATEEAFGRALCAAPALCALRVTEAQKKAARRAPALGAAALLLVAAAALLLILRPFSSRRIDRDSALGRLGLSGDPAGIRTVALYGSELKKSFEDGGVYQAYASVWSEKARLYLPGADELVPYGTLSDLSDFAQLTNLEELSLAGNAVSDVTPLLSLGKLRKLDLSSQQYDSLPPEQRPQTGLTLRGVGALTSLEVLYLNGSSLVDPEDPTCGLGELNALPSFRTLVLDPGEADLAASLGEVDYEIVFLGTVVSSYGELCAAAADPACHNIYLAAGSQITIPAGDEFVLPAAVMLSGVNAALRNEGTLRVRGWVECGMTEIRNLGTLTVEDGGSFIGGMSSTYNEGLFTVEAGGLHSLERGQEFFQLAGRYVNEGTLVFGWGGQFYLQGGTAVNDGLLIVEKNEDPAGAQPDGWLERKLAAAERLEGGGTIEIAEVNGY